MCLAFGRDGGGRLFCLVLHLKREREKGRRERSESRLLVICSVTVVVVAMEDACGEEAR